MLKKKISIAAAIFFAVVLVVLPTHIASSLRRQTNSVLKFPLSSFQIVSGLLQDLARFRENANENQKLKLVLSKVRFQDFQNTELRSENERLLKLVKLQKTTPAEVRRAIVARVVGRSPSTWNSAILVDKGSKQGLKEEMMVVSDYFLVGKTIEVGPEVSKVLLVTDPNSRVGVLVQRTRHGGVLFGVPGGQCRIKYLPLEAEILPGDLVETAGFGGFFPKGILIGEIQKVWKEPGELYQVASVKLRVDLSRLEEVICAD